MSYLTDDIKYEEYLNLINTINQENNMDKTEPNKGQQASEAGERVHHLFADMISMIRKNDDVKNTINDFIIALPQRRKFPQGLPANINKRTYHNPFAKVEKVIFDYDNIEKNCPKMYEHIMQDKFKPKVEKTENGWDLVVDVKVLDFDCNVTMSCPIHGLISYQDEHFTFEIEDDTICITSID